MVDDRYLESQRRIGADLSAGWQGWDAEQLAYLAAHKWAVLATGRRDGSPQLTMIGYVLDDDGALLISAKRCTAEHRRAELSMKVFGPIFGRSVDDPADLMPTLLREQRTVIRVTPTGAFFQA